MHVLIAPDCYTGTLTATQAAEAIAAGWRERAPDDLLTLVPLSDGGPGFIDVLAPGGPGRPAGETVAVTVSDPLGRDVPALILLTGEGHGGEGVPTAWIESAQACGLHLLGAAARDPRVTGTAGLGMLLDAALAAGARRIVVGLGGSGTNDGGAGMLAALGAGDDPVLRCGGLGLADLPDDALPRIAEVRRRLAGVELIAATDVDNPLLGLQGASAVYAPQKGADPQTAQDLERALGRWHEVVGRSLPAERDLLTGRARRLDREPGAGAAGGIGYALLVLGAVRRSGMAMVLDELGVDEVLAAADLVVTGEGCLDWQSLRGKVVAGVAQRAQRTATPVVVVPGQALVGRRETMAVGINGCYPVAVTPEEVEAAMADPVGTLRARAAAVAGTWSPRR